MDIHTWQLTVFFLFCDAPLLEKREEKEKEKKASVQVATKNDDLH